MWRQTDFVYRTLILGPMSALEVGFRCLSMTNIVQCANMLKILPYEDSISYKREGRLYPKAKVEATAA
jgi:hypothetical protein